jgi:phage gp45-like
VTHEQLRQLVHTVIRPLAIRISNIVRRGVIKRVDDAKKVQELQVRCSTARCATRSSASSSTDSRASRCLVLRACWSAWAGEADQTYCVGVEDRRYRPTVICKRAKSASTRSTEQTIILKTNGDIELNPKPGQKVKVMGPTELAGDVTVTGTLTASVDVVGGGKHLATHTHSVAGTVAAAPGPVVFVPPALTGGPS